MTVCHARYRSVLGGHAVSSLLSQKMEDETYIAVVLGMHLTDSQFK